MRISDWSSDVCSSDLLPNQAYQLALAQLMHRQVDRHPYRRQPLTLPLARLPTGLTEHELANRPDQPGLFGQADEIPRRDPAHDRMIPAYQRLGGIQATGRQA